MKTTGRQKTEKKSTSEMQNRTNEKWDTKGTGNRKQ